MKLRLRRRARIVGLRLKSMLKPLGIAFLVMYAISGLGWITYKSCVDAWDVEKRQEEVSELVRDKLGYQVVRVHCAARDDSMDGWTSCMAVYEKSSGQMGILNAECSGNLTFGDKHCRLKK